MKMTTWKYRIGALCVTLICGLAAYATELPVDKLDNFKNLPDFFMLTPSADGMTVEYNGISPHSRDLYLTETADVTPDEWIRIRFDFTKITWDFCARFMPVLEFLDANGKMLSRQDADNGYLCAADFSTNWKLGERSYYHNDFKVPVNAAKASICFNCRGNRFSFKIHKVIITPDGKDQSKAFFKTPVYPHQGAELARDGVIKLLNQRPAMNCETVQENGRIKLKINDTIQEPVIFKNGPVDGSLPEQLPRCATFRQAGFKIFVVNVPFGQTRGRRRGPVWTGPEQYDITQWEDAIYDIVAQVPDAMVMLELHVQPFYEWGIQNQDEIYCNPDGVKGCFTSRFVKFSNTPPPKNDATIWQPSLQSVKFREDTSKALQEAFTRFRSSPAVKALCGVYVNGGIDNQWFAPPHNLLDHSPAALGAWKNFLRKKYDNDINALRKAWKNNGIAFDTVKIPESEDLCCQGFIYDNAMAIDFNEMEKETAGTLFHRFCHAVKQGTGKGVLVGGYWPNGGLSSYPMSGHCNMEELLASPDVDFFAVVPDYFLSREPGQPRSESAYDGSMYENKKLLITELDIRTGEFRNWGMWGADFYMETHDKETFRNDLLSFVAWSKSMGGGFHAYDLTCGFWDSNSAIGAWTQGVSVFSAKSGTKLPNDQISVFVEEDDKHVYSQHPDFNTFQIGMREDLLRVFPLSGVPFHFYLPEDALRFDLTKQSRILLFGNASHMTAAQAEQIRKKYGNSGRIIIWNYLPGYLSRDNPADVCKFRIVPNPSVDRKPLSILPGVDNPVTEGLAGFNTNISTLRAGLQWQVKDPDAEILAVYHDTPFGAMAAKEYEDHMEIWIGQAGAITPQMIRNLAKMVNMTPVISTDEPTFLGSGMLALQAAFQGKKEITIPAPWTEFKVLTGQKQVEMKGKKPVFTLKAGETLILEVD